MTPPLLRILKHGNCPYLFLVALMIGNASSLHAQDQEPVLASSITHFEKNAPALEYPFFLSYSPRVKYEFGTMRGISLGLATIDWIGDDVVMVPAFSHWGPLIETGLAFVDSDTYLSSKLGYEYFLFFLGARANLIHYTDFSGNQFVFRPELGISLASYITFTYGYNLSFYSQGNLFPDGNVFSLNLAYPILHKKYR